MTKVAERFGLLDVALKKICDRHRVPTPARGYWAKKAAGKPAKQVPFHSTADPQHEHISIYGSQQNLAPEVKAVLDQELQRRKALPKVTPPPVIVEPALPVEDVHPSIARTAKALRKAKPDRDDVVRASEAFFGAVPRRAGRDAERRSCRAMSRVRWTSLGLCQRPNVSGAS